MERFGHSGRNGTELTTLLLIIFITTNSKNISKIRTLTYHLQSFVRGQFGLKSGPSLIIIMSF